MSEESQNQEMVETLVDFEGFDTEGVDMSSRASLIPAGNYVVVCTRAEYKRNKNGNGFLVDCEFQVTDGEQAGRKFWNMFNIKNENQQAEQIGKRDFSKLLQALGLKSIKSMSEVQDKPFVAELGFRKKSKDTDDEVNTIKKYFDRSKASLVATAGSMDVTEPPF